MRYLRSLRLSLWSLLISIRQAIGGQSDTWLMQWNAYVCEGDSLSFHLSVCLRGRFTQFSTHRMSAREIHSVFNSSYVCEGDSLSFQLIVCLRGRFTQFSTHRMSAREIHSQTDTHTDRHTRRQTHTQT